MMAGTFLLACAGAAYGQEKQDHWKFCFFPAKLPAATSVPIDQRYSDENGVGFDNGGADYPAGAGDAVTADHPMFFSVKVPEGNYKVTVFLGGAQGGNTTVKAELRRLMLDKVATRAGEQVSRTFAVSVRRAPIVDAAGKEIGMTKVKGREVMPGGQLRRTPGGEGWTWDDALTLEFSGTPMVRGVEIVRDDHVKQVFLCGDSTVCDQPAEPFNSWGQMITRWFAPDVVVSNLAISGETMPAFLGENRLTKITSQLKPGDVVMVQFGHNDMKSKAADALETYKKNLARFVTETKAKGGVPVLMTPVSRETFEGGKISNSFVVKRGEVTDDYVAAVKAVAKEQGVTLIDLNASSAALYEAMGEGKSQVLFATASEKTHHSDYGSYEIAKCVVQGIIDAKLDLAEHLVPEWKAFDPTKPDSEEAVGAVKDPVIGRVGAPAGN
jgi:lysophospholipase L1-like esterase